MKKLFATDFDGTLFFNEKQPEIQKEDVDAAACFQRQGGLFGVCSGRSLSGIQMSNLHGIKFDYYILASGAQIFDRSGNILEEHAINMNTAESILKYYGPLGRHIIHGRYDVYALDEGYPWQKHIHSLRDLNNDAVISLSIHLESKETAASVVKDMQQKYGSDIAPFQNVNVIDIAPAGCSKGKALIRAAELFHADQTGGIGDSYNDISLIKSADIGFTFHRSPSRVRNCADFLVDSEAEALELFMKQS